MTGLELATRHELVAVANQPAKPLPSPIYASPLLMSKNLTGCSMKPGSISCSRSRNTTCNIC